MAVVAWPAPSAPVDHSWRTASTATRVQALVIGASVPALVASGAYWLNVPYVALIAAFGVPIGAVLAVEGAGWMSSDDWWIGGLRAAAVAPLIAAALMIGSGLVSETGWVGETGMASIVGAVWLALLVVVFAELLALPVTVPVALVVAFLIRRSARLGTAAARPHVVALAAAAAIGGGVSVASVTGSLAAVAPGLQPIDWAWVSAGARLTLTIDNERLQRALLQGALATTEAD